MNKNIEKIILIIDETYFYHPQFVKDLLDKFKFHNYKLLVGLVTKTKKSNSIERYLIKNFFRLNLKELAFISTKLIFQKFSKIF